MKKENLIEKKERIKKEIMGGLLSVPGSWRSENDEYFPTGKLVNVALVDLDKLAEFLVKNIK